MLDRNNHWITPRANGWAYNAAREKALKEGGEVYIQNRESKIRTRNTYGRNDPCPPRG
jgi:hypothetical protein